MRSSLARRTADRDTAEFAELVDREPPAFANSMIELGLLSAMVLVLVGSLLLLKRRPVQADRA